MNVIVRNADGSRAGRVLQRQVLYDAASVDAPMAQAAAARLNPEIQIVAADLVLRYVRSEPMRAISVDEWRVAGSFVYRSNVFQFIFDKPRISSAKT
jgi:hypothetical protein